MPRKPRIDIPGLLYHIIVRGIEQREIFIDDIDREDFMKRVGESLEWSGARFFAWTLMPNHAHLLIRTEEKPLSKIMRKILTGYAVNYNMKHKRAGHLFQNRYRSIVCEKEPYLLELIRYIHLNPVRAKIVKDVDELNRYKWTGHAVIIGNKENKWQEVDEVLQHFSNNRKTACSKYIKFMKEGIGDGKREILTGRRLIRSMDENMEVTLNGKSNTREISDDRILGKRHFVDSVLKKIEKSDRLITKIKKGISLENLIEKICKYYEIKPSQLMGNSQKEKVTTARSILSYISIRYLGLNGNQLSREIGMSPSGVSRMYYKGETFLARNEKIISEILGNL